MSVSELGGGRVVVCKVSQGQGLSRRVSFPFPPNYNIFKLKIARSFSLELSSFRIAYRDDDGVDVEIATPHDLDEAVAYFSDDDPSLPKVTMKLLLILDYDGPSLSDAGSMAGGSERDGEGSFRDSASYRSYSSYSGASSNQWEVVRGPPTPPSLPPPSPWFGYRNQSVIFPLPPPVPPRPPTSIASSDFSYMDPPGRPAPTLPSNPSSSTTFQNKGKARASPSVSDADDSDSESVAGPTPFSSPPTYKSSGSGSSDASSIAPNGAGGGAMVIGTSAINSSQESLQTRWLRTLPPLLSDLSLSRMPGNIPQVPDELLRCSDCARPMSELRYICCLCGPILNEGRRKVLREENGDNDADSDGGTVLGDGENDHLLDPNEDPEHLHHSHKDEDQGGYELCADCVEAAGVRHSLEMAKLAKARAAGEGTEDGGELRHAYAEVMRMPKSSLLEWNEVDYEDDVHCTICGTGPVQTNRFKCLSCPKFELCLTCYRTVEEIHPSHAFLAIPDRPARPNLEIQAPPSPSHATPEEMRLAVLRARGIEARRPSMRTSSSIVSLKHPGVLCFGCLRDIVGARYSCALCPSFDLCAACESLDPPIASPDGRHAPTHILLKIPVPLSPETLDLAVDRARGLSRAGSSSGRSNGRGRREWDAPPYGDPYGRHPPPPPPHHYHRPPPHHHHHPYHHPPPPPSPPMYLTHPVPHWAARHNVICRGCATYIQGVRWLCAQCGSTPTYDLCSNCEKNSHVIHNPLHCFLRITMPLVQQLPPLSQLLPVLYDPSSPARFEPIGGGASSNGSSGSGGSSDGIHDGVVLHQNVICDACLEAISGPWMRCCHCSTSFDLCTECLQKVEHDPLHVFAKFTRRINMALFRDLTKISSPTPQPLLTFGIYG